eukprot:Rmarinus@m.12774
MTSAVWDARAAATATRPVIVPEGTAPVGSGTRGLWHLPFGTLMNARCRATVTMAGVVTKITTLCGRGGRRIIVAQAAALLAIAKTLTSPAVTRTTSAFALVDTTSTRPQTAAKTARLGVMTRRRKLEAALMGPTKSSRALPPAPLFPRTVLGLDGLGTLSGAAPTLPAAILAAPSPDVVRLLVFARGTPSSTLTWRRVPRAHKASP